MRTPTWLQNLLIRLWRHSRALAAFLLIALLGGLGGYLLGRDWNWLAVRRFRSPATLDCGGDVPGADNNMRSALAIEGGTDAFSALDSVDKTVTAAPGSHLQGQVRFRVSMHAWPAFHVEMIGTSSWGDPKTSYWRIAWTAPVTIAPVSLKSPARPGAYHIVFAMELEMFPVSVASATNWTEVARHGPVWDRSTEIAAWSALQIAQAQRFGCAVAAWRGGLGNYVRVVAPADAITVVVR